MTTATNRQALVTRLRTCADDFRAGRALQAGFGSVLDLLVDAAEALSSSVSSETLRGPCIPMCRLASSTHADVEGVERCDLCGHPAEQPAASSETQEERPAEIATLREQLSAADEEIAACRSEVGGMVRAAFEAGCHARPVGDDGWTFEPPSASQARAATEAYAAYEQRAQSSPVPHEASRTAAHSSAVTHEADPGMVTCLDCGTRVPVGQSCPNCGLGE